MFEFSDEMKKIFENWKASLAEQQDRTEINQFVGPIKKWLNLLHDNNQLDDKIINSAIRQIFTHVRFKQGMLELRCTDRPPIGYEFAPVAFWVGLLTDDPKEVLEEGAQLVESLEKPIDMLGHVTPSYFSPNLNKSIALAVVRSGKNMKGQKLIIPMENKQINVTVSDPVFLDKENKRLNA